MISDGQPLVALYLKLLSTVLLTVFAIYFHLEKINLGSKKAPPHRTTLVEVAQRNVGGLDKHVTCHISEFLFFSFLFLLASADPQVAFLDRSGRFIRQNACFRPKRSTIEKMHKVMSTAFTKMSRDLLLEFWNPLYISETAEPTNF